MAILRLQVAIWSVSVAACAFILHHTGYRPLKGQQAIEAQLGLYDSAADTPDTFVVYVGRLLFFASVLAWAVVIAQSLVSAVRRYRRTPAAVPPLQPLSPEEIKQHTVQPQTATPSGHQQPADEAEIAKLQQQQQQQHRPDRERNLEVQRRRAAEEKQRQFDEAAAARKQQQERDEADRKARAAAAAAQAAAQAAALHRQQEQQQHRTRAAEQRQWEAWEQAVLQQYRRSDGAAGSSSSSFGGPTLGHSSTPSAAGSVAPHHIATADQIAAAAATAYQDRQLRQQQDHEYHASLAADQQRQQHKRSQQNLKHLKQLLQQKYAAAGGMKNGSNGLPDGCLSVRVKMPDGGSAVRTFAADQSLADVYEWVFSLDTMTCLAPGSWCLSTTYPKQTVLPAGGIWSPGGCSAGGLQLQQYIHELQSDGGGVDGCLWGLSVRQMTGEELMVLVRDDSPIFDVKEKLQLQTGTPPAAQRLIFSGRMLQDDSTLQQLGITADHTLQLASAVVPQPRPQPGSTGGGQGQLATSENADGDKADARAVGREAGGSVETETSTVSSELVVSDVRQLRAEVAAGASQLALYVVTDGA